MRRIVVCGIRHLEEGSIESEENFDRVGRISQSNRFYAPKIQLKCERNGRDITEKRIHLKNETENKRTHLDHQNDGLYPNCLSHVLQKAKKGG